MTYMAEYGLFFQFFYIAGWCLILLFCWPMPWTPLRAVAFISWITLGLCGCFSSVLSLIWLWLIPGLLLCLCQSFCSKCWPSKSQWLFALCSVPAAVLALQGVAHAFAGDSRIAASSDWVKIGERPERVAVIQPDRQIPGDKYGHTIRECIDEIGGFTVFRSSVHAADLSAFDTIVLSGSPEISDLRKTQGSIVWMNPSAEVSEAVLERLKTRSLTVIVGNLGDWRRLRVWRSLTDENSNWNLIRLRNVADFIPNWPQYIIVDPDE